MNQLVSQQVCAQRLRGSPLRRFSRTLVGLLALAAVAGCTTSQGSAGCDLYLQCLAVLDTPNLQSELTLYGHNGTCWTALPSATCEQACASNLSRVSPSGKGGDCEDGNRPRPGRDSGGVTPDLGDGGGPEPFSCDFDFGVKSMYYAGAMSDPMLTGDDPMTGKWRCKRDDSNPSNNDPAILRMMEPNDCPQSAISLSYPLPVDPPPGMTGFAYEVCPDRTDPMRPDQDVFKFKLSTPETVVAEVKYQVTYGDLDIALFRDTLDPMTGMHTQQRVFADLTAVNNACIEATNLPSGTYYLVVRGAPSVERPGEYWMNSYQVRVFGVVASGYHCS